MADAIVRLKLESQEYDGKLKRAVDQMTRMEQEVRRTGATFAYADKEEIAFVQSLGQMSTQATSSMQKLREYSNAIMSLTETYRAMSAEEKNSDFGKAMAASIDELKAKAANLKDIMADTQSEIKRLSSDTGVFDQLAGGISTVTAAFQVGQGAMQAFGVKSQDAMQAMARLQGIMAVTNGLTKIQAALQKEYGKDYPVKVEMLKRGIAGTLQELLMSAEYIMAGGNDQIILCERGIRTYETYTRNTLDLAAVPVLKELSHLPVIVDPSHGCGLARLVKPMSLAAAACGADGLMIEVHNDPAHALCDGAQSLTPDQFDDVARQVAAIRDVICL